MREFLKSGVETTDEAKKLRQDLGSEESIAYVSAEIEIHFQRPVIVTGEKFKKDWLALAASASLMPLILDLRNSKSSRVLENAFKSNEAMVIQVLQAG